MLGKSSRRCAITRPARRKPLAPRVAALLREAWWLSAVALALYLGMILVTYHAGDPGWSRTGDGHAIVNAGGAFGAWLADLLLYLFGVSAWCWVILALFLVWWGYRRIGETDSEHRHGLTVTLSGFLIVLLTSGTLEAMRFHTLSTSLPLTSGGAFGDSLSRMVQGVFGFDGGTVILLLAWGAGISLFTGLSWIGTAERTGAALEALFALALSKWQARRDRAAGAEATSEREEVVRQERKRIRKEAPVRIEAPPLAIEKSERREEERQEFLFRDSPDAQRPPLRLLDEPPEAATALDQAGGEGAGGLSRPGHHPLRG